MTEAFLIEKLFWILAAVVSAVISWFMKHNFERLDRQRDELVRLAREMHELRAELPAHYVNKGEFQKMGDNIFSMLRRIEGTSRSTDRVEQNSVDR